MTRLTCLLMIGTLASGLLIAPDTARADDILDQIDEAIALYKQGDYSGAIAEFDFITTQIRQLQAGRVADALPPALPGWKTEDAETNAMSGAMLGGGISAERTYTKGKAEVDIQLIGESPMLQGILMMFKNPMILSSSGKKLKRISGLKAACEYDADDRSGEIMMVAHNAVLITVQGTDVDEDDLQAYAEAIDIDLIGKVVSGN